MKTLTGRRPTVVIVDDHPNFLVSVRNLVQVDCDVLAAVHDGRQAVEAVISLNPDVVVLDVSMPILDGFAAARRMRELGMNTKIVFLTATEDADYAAAARELGGNYVMKRKMRQELLAVIRGGWQK